MHLSESNMLYLSFLYAHHIICFLCVHNEIEKGTVPLGNIKWVCIGKGNMKQLMYKVNGG